MAGNVVQQEPSTGRASAGSAGSTRVIGLAALVVAVVVFALIAGLAIVTQAGTMADALVFTQSGDIIDGAAAEQAGLAVVTSPAAFEQELQDNINIKAVVLTADTAGILGSETLALLYNRGIIVGIVGLNLDDARRVIGLGPSTATPMDWSTQGGTNFSVVAQVFCDDSGSQTGSSAFRYDDEQAMANSLELYIASFDCARQLWLPLGPAHP